MTDDTTLYLALRAFVMRRRDYEHKAARAKEHWYSADARANCHLALARLQRAEQDLLSTWDEAHADPIPALLAKLEAEAPRPVVAAPGETLEETIVGARYVLAEEGEA